MTKKEVPYHCNAPWISLSINVDRSFSLCINTMNSTSLGNWDNQSILETMNSELINTYRNSFIKNESQKICELCLIQESNGINSKRLDYINEYPSVKEINNPIKLSDIKRLELSLSNSCNLACRTCSSLLSSQWNNDSDKLRRETHHYPPPTNKQFNELIEVSKTLDSILLSGGEPLYQEQVFVLLESLICNGNTNCKITINTSLSVDQDAILRLINISKKLPNLKLNISLDGINQKGEYIRSGMNFKDFEKNILLISSSNIECAIQITISILNIFDLREILEYINESPLGITQGLEFCFVTNPLHYNIQILPKKIKSILQAEIYSLILDFKENEKIRPLLRKVLTVNSHLQIDNDSKSIKDFLRETKRVDRLRNQSFEKTFSNTYQLLSSF